MDFILIIFSVVIGLLLFAFIGACLALCFDFQEKTEKGLFFFSNICIVISFILQAGHALSALIITKKIFPWFMIELTVCSILLTLLWNWGSLSNFKPHLRSEQAAEKNTASE